MVLRTSSLLTKSSSHPPLPFPALSALASRYQKATQSAPPPILSLTGRYLAFLYHLISTLIAAPHCYAVVVVDADYRFDVTRIVVRNSNDNGSTSGASFQNPQSDDGKVKVSSSYPATTQDLKHLYVYRPARSPAAVKAAVSSAAEYMLYAAHGSRDRAWWGTVVINGTGGDVNAIWKGWLEVRREEIAGFGVGMCVEEALKEREKRQATADARGWEAVAAGGRLGVYRWDG
ncbi:uncharacterized protein BCR38DRAFT_451014 [Pseudomassariella vexata]|uniref:Uncharacterized protein n=1 Tax=Pseudomassariella vexata TaxID=1141098 RepID=A0A1Y2DCB2_9PEZI|nr:uncharacterized protein BCR38DRAFT_451014 [Pseudomassariella vexata]ORY56315.1 hypothetical protein BCR38DRAFT_451014 [Pseudomassariella vexata]